MNKSDFEIELSNGSNLCVSVEIYGSKHRSAEDIIENDDYVVEYELCDVENEEIGQEIEGIIEEEIKGWIEDIIS